MSEKEIIETLEKCMKRENPQCENCEFKDSTSIILTCSELLKACLEKIKELEAIKDGG